VILTKSTSGEFQPWSTAKNLET